MPRDAFGQFVPPQSPRQFLAQLVDQQPHLRQQMPPLRIDRPDRLLLWVERVEERDERAALQVRHHIEIGKLADASVLPTFVTLSPVQGPWPASFFDAVFFCFTQRHEEEGAGRYALFSINAAAGRTVRIKSRFAANAPSLCLCVKKYLAPPQAPGAGPWMLKRVRHDEKREGSAAKWGFPTLFRRASLRFGSSTASIFAPLLKATKETVSRCTSVSFVALRTDAHRPNPPCRAAMGRWQRRSR